jgi:putative membrane protein
MVSDQILDMNTNTKSCHAPVRADLWFSKLVARSGGAGLGLALAAAGLFLAAPGTRAQSNLSTMDTKFMLAAAQGGITEVKLGELAVQKGIRDDVKGFGQLMIKDHTVINGDLKALATQKGVTLPDGLDPEHQATVDKMAALTGTAFDDAYITGMVKAHTMDAKAFRAESAATQDAGIKRFLDNSLPVVERHLQHITAMKK